MALEKELDVRRQPAIGRTPHGLVVGERPRSLDRISAMERRVAELDERVSRLEQQRPFYVRALLFLWRAARKLIRRTNGTKKAEPGSG